MNHPICRTEFHSVNSRAMGRTRMTAFTWRRTWEALAILHWSDRKYRRWKRNMRPHKKLHQLRSTIPMTVTANRPSEARPWMSRMKPPGNSSPRIPRQVVKMRATAHMNW